MTVEADIYARLGPLVAGRAYPNTFPQSCTWPAIRYTLTTRHEPTVCGDAGDDDAEHRVQVDLVAAGYDAVRALRLSARAAMDAGPWPVTLDLDESMYDEDAKVHRVVLVYVLHPSTA